MPSKFQARCPRRTRRHPPITVVFFCTGIVHSCKCKLLITLLLGERHPGVLHFSQTRYRVQLTEPLIWVQKLGIFDRSSALPPNGHLDEVNHRSWTGRPPAVIPLLTYKCASAAPFRAGEPLGGRPDLCSVRPFFRDGVEAFLSGVEYSSKCRWWI